MLEHHFCWHIFSDIQDRENTLWISWWIPGRGSAYFCHTSPPDSSVAQKWSPTTNNPSGLCFSTNVVYGKPIKSFLHLKKIRRWEIPPVNQYKHQDPLFIILERNVEMFKMCTLNMYAPTISTLWCRKNLVVSSCCHLTPKCVISLATPPPAQVVTSQRLRK